MSRNTKLARDRKKLVEILEQFQQKKLLYFVDTKEEVYIIHKSKFDIKL